VDVLIVLSDSARGSPRPVIVVLLLGFGIGVLGYLSGSKVLVAIGVALVFVAGLLAPMFP
jgi:F0F1-type ATP synthase assembly protein I